MGVPLAKAMAHKPTKARTAYTVEPTEGGVVIWPENRIEQAFIDTFAARVAGQRLGVAKGHNIDLSEDPIHPDEDDEDEWKVDEEPMSMGHSELPGAEGRTARDWTAPGRILGFKIRYDAENVMSHHPIVMAFDGETEIGFVELVMLDDPPSHCEDEWTEVRDELERRGALGVYTYAVVESWLADEYHHNRIGVGMYEAAMAALSDPQEPVILVASRCRGGPTSHQASRVWESMARRYVSSGQVVSSVPKAKARVANVARRFMAKATGTRAGDGSSVGLFIRLPKHLATQFPGLGENDSSPSHVTFLYIGDFKDKDEQARLVVTLRDILRRWWPKCKASLGDLEYFDHPDKNRRVPHVSVDFDKDLSGFKQRVMQELRDEGFEVGDKFPEFKPHVTLAYMPGMDGEWDKPVPEGSWDVTEMEIWGMPRVHTIPIGKASSQRVASLWLEGSTHAKSVALMRFLSRLAQRLGVARHTYVVGGAIRNFLIEQPIKDIDVVIDSVAAGKDSEWFAEQVARAIPAPTNLTTNQYGVAILTVKGDWDLDGESLKGEVIEIANARKESYGGAEGKGYKPHMVEPTTIDEDVYRREFTFNCMGGDTLIPTKRGILRIDEIASRENGDRQDIHLTVAGQDGPSEAVGWQYSGYAPTLRVTSEWGHTFTCTHHHPVLVLRGHDHEWVQADQLAEGDLLCVPVRQVSRRDPLALDLPDPVQPKRGRLKGARKPEIMTPELAFLIGCVVAEGSNTHKRVSFSNSDPNLISRYAECFHATFGFLPSRNKVVSKGSVRVLRGVEFVANHDGYDIYADSKAVVGWLEDLGLYCGGSKDGKSASHHKVVPWSILQADARSQWAFLAAYLEGDGSIRPDTGRITYCSASPKVRQQLQVLLGAHGILSKVKDRFVYLSAVDSALLWEKVRPWMVTKGFDYTRDSKSRNRYGIPADHIRGFLAGRKQARSVYATDEGGLRSLPDAHEPVRKVQRLLHDAYARGDFDGLLSSLKIISGDEHAKLQRLFDLGYQYVEVASVEDAGDQDVFDISMGEGVEPAFVANGVVVHNTLMWRLLDLTHGPEKAEVIDLTGCGRRDLEQGVLKCPRDPDIVFADDATRILRAIKFTGKYGFKIPPDLAAAIKRNAPKMKQMPYEALKDILVDNILPEPTARKSLQQMKDLGILDVLHDMIQEQKPFASAIAKVLGRERRVQVLLDWLHLGLPAKTPLHFLGAHERVRVREITVPMDEDKATDWMHRLIKPPVNNNEVIEAHSLVGRDRAMIMPLARKLILVDPDLAYDGRALTREVIERWVR